MKHAIFVSMILSVSLLGCSKEPAPQPNAPAALAQNTAEAKHAAHAVPGSYEDWCGEHQLPESQCTRCNPALIPAFKATGDWCEEHQVPESQCLKCNPDLKIERPPQKAK